MYRSLFVNQETLHPIQILAFSITTMYVHEDYKSKVGLGRHMSLERIPISVQKSPFIYFVDNYMWLAKRYKETNIFGMFWDFWAKL